MALSTQQLAVSLLLTHHSPPLTHSHSMNRIFLLLLAVLFDASHTNKKFAASTEVETEAEPKKEAAAVAAVQR